MYALKDWRKKTADELQRPIYRIMSNQLLEDVARLKPRTTEQLSSLSGVGPYALRQYGKRILAVVSQYASEDPDNSSGVNTEAFWESIKALKPKEKKAATKKKKIAEDGTEVVEDIQKVARKPLKRRPKIPVMTSEELAEMEADQLSENDLNAEQIAAANHIMQGHNCFITGSAGTGKVCKLLLQTNDVPLTAHVIC